MTAAEAKKLDAEIAELMATTAKLNAETKQISVNTYLSPFLAAAAVMGATAALIKLLFT